MDIYVIMQVIILFGAIFLGVRLGGMGIGYAGGLGVVLLSLGMGMFPGQIPWDVILMPPLASTVDQLEDMVRIVGESIQRATEEEGLLEDLRPIIL